MDRDSARPNIDHLRTLPANETDEAKRAVPRGLLAEEKAKLIKAEELRFSASRLIYRNNLGREQFKLSQDSGNAPLRKVNERSALAIGLIG